MITTSLDTLLDGGAFYECPRWHEGRLWVSDFWGRQVSAVAPDGTAEIVHELPGSPSGLGWLPDGTLLVLSMLDNVLLRAAPGGGLEPWVDLTELSTGAANDLVVDATGGCYVSTMDFAAAPGTMRLLRVDPDGVPTVAAEGLSFPNGSVITPDGATLVLAESWAGALTAFDIGVDGALSGRRQWALPYPGQGVAPDGIALDAEGAVWLADAGGRRALRVRRGGEVLDEVSTGELSLVACALGGPDGRTLFLCATPTYDPAEASRLRQAAVLTCRVEVPTA